MLFVLLAIAGLPVAAVFTVVTTAAYRERQLRALRRCPCCQGTAMVRVLPRPPHDGPRYRRAAIAYRCGTCEAYLFELVRDRAAGLLTGEQLDARLVAQALPTATLHRG